MLENVVILLLQTGINNMMMVDPKDLRDVLLSKQNPTNKFICPNGSSMHRPYLTRFSRFWDTSSTQVIWVTFWENEVTLKLQGTHVFSIQLSRKFTVRTVAISNEANTFLASSLIFFLRYHRILLDFGNQSYIVHDIFIFSFFLHLETGLFLSY